MSPAVTTPPRILAQRFEPECDLTTIHEHARNARRGDEEFIAQSIEVNGFFGAMVVDERTREVLVGNHRFRMLTRAGGTVGPVLWITPDDDAHATRIMLVDNATNDRAGYAADKLAELLAEVKASPGGLRGTGYTEDALEKLRAEINLPRPGGGGDGESEGDRGPNLQERFGVPPFSVLDARQGYWQDRKRAWIAIGIRSELGRGLDAAPGGGALPDDRPSADGTMPHGHFHGHSSTPAAVGGGGLSDALAPRPKKRGGRGGKGEAFEGSGVRTVPEHSPENIQAAYRARAPRPGGPGADAPAQPFGEKYKGGDAWRGRAPDPTSYKSQDRLHALQKTGDSRVGGGRLTWAPGDRAISDLDETTQKIIALGGRASSSGTSIFDPVLCELAYRWFSPPGGSVLDVFAGGSVRGIVAAKLGRRYTGVELRAEQVAANRAQAAEILKPSELAPVWLEGDSRELPAEAVPGSFDFVFSCPPYADLEVYSDDPRDLSTLEYGAFREAYAAIIARAIAQLRDDRFALFVVGEVRSPDGFYKGFVHDTIKAFETAGARLYNEAVLITAVGSLPVRAGRAFEAGRKLGRGHQAVLVFCKGNPKRATEACGTVEFAVSLEPEPLEGTAQKAEDDEEEPELSPPPTGSRQVKVSAAMLNLRFNGCDPEYIRDTCHAKCCESSSAPGGTMITIHRSEQAAIEARGGVVREGMLTSVNKRCPFKDERNLCGLHETEAKPFGCIASPFTLNANGTLIVRNRYKLLKCYQDGRKVPAYDAFRASLDLIFGAEEADRICAHARAGGGDLMATMPAENYAKLVENDETKRKRPG